MAAEPQEDKRAQGVDGDVDVDVELMGRVMPGKSSAKLRKWVATLHDEEYTTVGDLRRASPAAWAALPLPGAVRDALRRHVDVVGGGAAAATTATAAGGGGGATAGGPSPHVDHRPIVQVDLILFDVSGSMRGRSFDNDKTRAEAGKILFQAMIDKLIGAELPHAVGLLTFGERFAYTELSRDATKFEGALGGADTNQGSTLLYDAIHLATDHLARFKADHAAELDPACAFRVFCLTDGEDTGSRHHHWEVTRRLYDLGFVLDAFPLAGFNKWLKAMAANTGGLCLSVSSTPRGIGLFEREAVLRVCCREVVDRPPPPNSADDLSKLVASQGAQAVTDVRSAVPAQTKAATLCGSYEVALASKKASSPASRRIFHEMKELSAEQGGPAVDVFVNADDHFFWKVIIEGVRGTPYEGGRWLLTVQFSSEHPFKPPAVRFAVPIYHVNVSADGKICMDLLSGSWSPAVTITKLLLAIRILMENPNADDPLDTYKAALFRDKREQYNAEARQHTAKHASNSVDAIKQQFNIS